MVFILEWKGADYYCTCTQVSEDVAWPHGPQEFTLCAWDTDGFAEFSNSQS